MIECLIFELFVIFTVSYIDLVCQILVFHAGEKMSDKKVRYLMTEILF